MTSPAGSVYINCCNTELCNNGTATDTGNNIAYKVLSTLALGLIIGGSVLGFCLLVCFIICIAAIYLCCFIDRSQGNSNPPSVYVVGSQMGNFQHQLQLQLRDPKIIRTENAQLVAY